RAPPAAVSLRGTAGAPPRAAPGANPPPRSRTSGGCTGRPPSASPAHRRVLRRDPRFPCPPAGPAPAGRGPSPWSLHSSRDPPPLTARVQCPGASVAEKLLGPQRDPAQPGAELRAEPPPEIAVLVPRLLAKDPAERFALPADLALLLQEWLSLHQEPFDLAPH